MFEFGHFLFQRQHFGVHHVHEFDHVFVRRCVFHSADDFFLFAFVVQFEGTPKTVVFKASFGLIGFVTGGALIDRGHAMLCFAML